MCGIAGVLGWTDNDRLGSLLDCIVHRGPDDEGRFVDRDADVMMGARRLSIIDLAGGNQPITNEDGDVVVVFNGEIYNYESLRVSLEAEGHRFTTDCDTEVLVHLWEEYGTAMPSKLDGMFAFSIWDRDAETLFLARDRLGIKPLYVAETDDAVVWGSEVQSLVAAGVDRTVDEKAVHNYFSLRYTPHPQTMLESVRKVAPGTSLLVTDDGVTRETYWRLDRSSPTDLSRGGSVAEIRRLLERSVDRRLMADVPVGAFLSGGLDSSAIVGLMSESCAEPVQTFSIGFESASHDESAEARYVADHFGTDHHEFIIDLSTMDLFEDLVRSFGEPLADPAALPTMVLAEHASEEVTVALTGEGADELFGGYRYFDRIPKYRQRARRLPQAVFSVSNSLSEVIPAGQQYLRFFSSLRSDRDMVLEWVKGYDAPPERVLRTTENPDTTGLSGMVEDATSETDNAFDSLAQFKLAYWLSNDLLYKVDQTTMRSSLEARVPFLDHELVRLIATLPPRWKTGGYKPLLNEAVADVVPERTRQRSKHGFRVPIGEWFEQDLPAIARWFTESKLEATPYLSPAAVFDLHEEHRRGTANHKGLLWRTLTYVAWYHTIVEES